MNCLSTNLTEVCQLPKVLRLFLSFFCNLLCFLRWGHDVLPFSLLHVVRFNLSDLSIVQVQQKGPAAAGEIEPKNAAVTLEFQHSLQTII